MYQQGGAAGSATGEGVVYCMKTIDKKEYKIGCTSNIKRRLPEIQAGKGRKKTVCLFTVPAIEMRGAETAAQTQAKKQLGFKKIEAGSGATDWFSNPKRKTKKKIEEVITYAVKVNNDEQEKKKKGKKSRK
ncbi:hypothetical protein ACJMK2_011905 [Sinanodonta woodiana]|uniref:Bacteriophage T5 Orf172 DNA-binding domain-containing protein n=1 Tax=Sinanodonta woodiana TaxID=1069815 RepID=A0ABD3V8W5_SINWO